MYVRIWSISARDEGCRFVFSGKTSTMPNTVEEDSMCHFHAVTESSNKGKKFCPRIPKLLQEGSVLLKFR
jgi:hypothetical protein